MVNYLVNYIIIIEIDKTKAAFLSCLLIDQHFDALDFAIAIKVRLVFESVFGWSYVEK